MKTSYGQRRKAAQAQLKTWNVDSLVVAHPANWQYLTGFTGDSGTLIISSHGDTLITDGRFTVQAQNETTNLKISLQEGSLLESVGRLLQKSRAKKVGFDAGRVTVSQLAGLRKAGGRGIAWKPVEGVVESLRMKKDDAELGLMRKACALADSVVAGAVKLLKEGVREIEIAAEIEYQMRRSGASGPAFETIVAFGKRSVLPHARATAKRLKKNELVVIDLGAILAHYCSDITRTFYFGKAPARVRRWHKGVLEAQACSIAALVAGATYGDVDAAARGVLERHGLGKYFVHSTGHGLGLEVHEDPRVGRGQKRLVEAGNVVTIEPGVYVEGVGGIRIEDDVVVHANRTEVLTRISRDLIEL